MTQDTLDKETLEKLKISAFITVELNKLADNFGIPRKVFANEILAYIVLYVLHSLSDDSNRDDVILHTCNSLNQVSSSLKVIRSHGTLPEILEMLKESVTVLEDIYSHMEKQNMM